MMYLLALHLPFFAFHCFSTSSDEIKASVWSCFNGGNTEPVLAITAFTTLTFD